jgi:hypothetical protein
MSQFPTTENNLYFTSCLIGYHTAFYFAGPGFTSRSRNRPLFSSVFPSKHRNIVATLLPWRPRHFAWQLSVWVLHTLCPPPLVTWLQLLRKQKNTGISTALTAQTHCYTGISTALTAQTHWYTHARTTSRTLLAHGNLNSQTSVVLDTLWNYFCLSIMRPRRFFPHPLKFMTICHLVWATQVYLRIQKQISPWTSVLHEKRKLLIWSRNLQPQIYSDYAMDLNSK